MLKSPKIFSSADWSSKQIVSSFSFGCRGRWGLEMEFTELQCFDSGHRDSNGQGGHLNPGSATLMSPGQPGWKSGFQPTATSSRLHVTFLRGPSENATQVYLCHT